MKSSKRHTKKYKKSNKSKTRKQQRGGNSPSFQGLPLRYYYDMNDFYTDPIRNVVNSRLSGGKRGKTHRQRGGFIGFSSSPFFGNASFNIPASFGSTPFAHISQNIQSGSISSRFPQNPSTIEQPTEMKYNYNNPPLV